jgi:hypothetical protein
MDECGGRRFRLGWLDAPAWMGIVTAGLVGYSGLHDRLPVRARDRPQVVTIVMRRMALVWASISLGVCLD